MLIYRVREGEIITTADKIVNLLQSNESVNLVDYGELFANYIEERKVMLGVTKPFNLYFSQATMEKNANGSARVFRGINALTKEAAPNGLSARGGGNSENEIYVSVDITGSYNSQTRQYNYILSPSEKRKVIIKVLFTIEHELGHDEQRKDLNSSIVSPRIIKLAKSMAFVDFWKEAGVFRCAYSIVNGKEVDPSYMYQNTHEYLFVEQDANDRAFEVVSTFLKSNGAAWLLGELIDYYNSKKPSNNKLFEASFVEYDSNSKRFFRGTIDELIDYTIDYYSGFKDITEKYPVLKSDLDENLDIKRIS